jgi:hypothetical protein
MHSVNKTIPPNIRTKTPHKLTQHHYQLVNSPLFSTASIAWRVRGFLSEFARFQLVRMDEMLPLEPWLWNGEITLAVFWAYEGEKRWIFTKQYGIFTSKQYGSSQHHPTSSNQNEDLANKHGDLANQKNINKF